MRLFGLTLALLTSSLGARAESVEDRMTALEQQVKTLQEALRNQGGLADQTTASHDPRRGSWEQPRANLISPSLSIEDGQADGDKIVLINSK